MKELGSYMEWTTGSIMFYGGAVGAGAAFLALLITLIAFHGGKKRLRRKLDEEYGKQETQGQR